MVDHFSKFADSKIITNKTKETVLSAIKEIFFNMRFPKMLQSDNGTEFKNKLYWNYLQKKKIDHIFGSPYHPYSHVSVEKFNRTIQYFLISTKDDLKKNFNLKECAVEFLLHYNERTHSTTKYKPREIFERAQDQDFIK